MSYMKFFSVSIMMLFTSSLFARDWEPPKYPFQTKKKPGFMVLPQTSSVDVEIADPARNSNYKPCGIALSYKGAVAVSCIQSVYSSMPGVVLIWKSYNDFIKKKIADYSYAINQPESVAFDGNGVLFISSCQDGFIYYTSDISQAPTQKLTTNSNDYSTPRGITFDDKNDVLVVFENQFPAKSFSSIVRFSNPYKFTTKLIDNPLKEQVKLTQDNDLQDNALGLTYTNGNLYATDLKHNLVKKYAYTNGKITYPPQNIAGFTTPLDIATNGTQTFLTTIRNGNTELYNLANSSTPFKTFPLNNEWAAWGVAVTSWVSKSINANYNLLVCDGASDKIYVYAMK